MGNVRHNNHPIAKLESDENSTRCHISSVFAWPKPFLRDILLTYLLALQGRSGYVDLLSAGVYSAVCLEEIPVKPVFADIAAGIFSNYIPAIESYFVSRPKMRLLFVSTHFSYPILLLWALEVCTFRKLLPGIFSIA